LRFALETALHKITACCLRLSPPTSKASAGPKRQWLTPNDLAGITHSGLDDWKRWRAIAGGIPKGYQRQVRAGHDATLFDVKVVKFTLTCIHLVGYEIRVVDGAAVEYE
jgi:hypothetical protein